MCEVVLYKALGILEIVCFELIYAQCGFCASYAKLKVGLLWAILVTKTLGVIGPWALSFLLNDAVATYFRRLYSLVLELLISYFL